MFAGDNGAGGVPVGLVRRRDVAETDPRALAVRCGVDCLGIYDDPVDGSVTVELFTGDGPLARSSAGCLALGWWLAAQNTPVTTVRVADDTFTVAQSSHFGGVYMDPEAGSNAAVLHQIADVDRIETVTSSELPEQTNCVWAYSVAESAATVQIKRMTQLPAGLGIDRRRLDSADHPTGPRNHSRGGHRDPCRHELGRARTDIAGWSCG